MNQDFYKNNFGYEMFVFSSSEPQIHERGKAQAAKAPVIRKQRHRQLKRLL